MELLGAALPNIMFIVGVLAVGLGLGIELKVISLNKEIDKKGRFGAFVAGLVLIGASVTIYLNPSLTNRSQGATPAAATAQLPQVAAAAPAPTQAQALTQAPTPMQAQALAQAPAPGVPIPNLHGMDDKGAQRALAAAGLKPLKAERCTGADPIDPKPKKGRVQCQNPPAGQIVAAGSSVEYVLAGK